MRPPDTLRRQYALLSGERQEQLLELVGRHRCVVTVLDALLEAGRLDWRIGFAGLNAGDRLTLDLSTTPAVPEPDDWAMMLAGLGMIALSAARRIGR